MFASLNSRTYHDISTWFPYVWKAGGNCAEFQSGKSMDELVSIQISYNY